MLPARIFRSASRSLQTSATAFNEATDAKFAPTSKQVDELFKTEDSDQRRPRASFSVNKLELAGHVPMEPQIKQLNNGSELVRFPIATKNPRTQTDNHDFHWVDALGQVGKYAKDNVKKGSQVHFIGHISYGEWQPEGADKKRKITRFTADFLSVMKRAGQQQE
ncbi:unnamed protein product, partial [Mesorhabditis spiculigera]